jgi:ABC-type antimicrobial peptide transport system permease subunit
VLWHSFLPALSIVILGMAVWFQTMKLVVQSVVGESYVQYARLGGVTESKIVTRYVFRNALLPQITGLALSLGLIFSGALITEIVFSYPGLGSLLIPRDREWRLQSDHGHHDLLDLGHHHHRVAGGSALPAFRSADQVFVNSV